MGEEIGSPGLAEVCRQHAALLAADIFIASEGPRLHADRPTLFLGSRGCINFKLHVQGRDRAYHSGLLAVSGYSHHCHSTFSRGLEQTCAATHFCRH